MRMFICVAVTLACVVHARAQDARTEQGPVHFVAEFAGDPEAKDQPLALDVTFFGTRPDSTQVEAVLKGCLTAAGAVHAERDIVARAWYRERKDGDDRAALALAGGASALAYSGSDQSIKPVGASAATAESGGSDESINSVVLANRRVVKACEPFKGERVQSLVTAGASNENEERKHVLKAMRTWCEENDVPIDRTLQNCISTISRAVMSARKEVAAEVVSADLPAAIARGLDAYGIGRCSRCHGNDATGGRRGPDLTDNRWDNCDGTVDGIRRVLVNGVPNTNMGPATSVISDEQQLTDLAIYIHSLSQK